ncbi:Cupredoxin [Immersiella caudata]|uniref:Cupredoxin n=1 Tax=Immersiella caudata TaxID=314043 RepID=A0AA40C6K6_9PEZI|nr:Cupredoxin [Immersiella caudata]
MYLHAQSLTRLVVLFFFLVSVNSHVIKHENSPRQAIDTWTTLPTPSPSPVVSCNAQITTSCYGYAATWTVGRITTTITANSYGVPASSATLLAVQTASSQPFVWPPPKVLVSVNQRVRIVLVNAISDPPEQVTLHFHGLLMKGGYGPMDGPEMVTQCGVSNGEFIYDFLAEEAGTYWIHSHDPGQYPKGLRSPLIIQDTTGDNAKLKPHNQNYDYDMAVGLSDWWHDFWGAEEKYKASSRTGKPCNFGVEIVPGAALFNDYVPNITDLKVTQFEVQPSQDPNNPFRTRFRFINMSSFSQFFVKFEQHIVTTVEVDGILINPDGQETEGFTVAAGQRVSVVLESKTEPDPNNGYRILVALDPSLAPENVNDATNCLLPNFSSNLTIFTWGCLTYTGSPTTCLTTDGTGIDMFKYTPGGSPYRQNWFSKKLHVPWKAHTHTQDAFAWNFDERTFEPLDTQPNLKGKLMSVRPGNIHWLKLKDMPVQLDPLDRGYGAMNEAL